MTMKLPSIATIFLTTALLWAPTAFADILNTWNLADALSSRRENDNASRGDEATLHASDGSANYTGTTWLNGTGGEGWSGAWTPYKGTGNIEAECKVEAPSLALATKTEMGEVVVGRDLASPLSSGELSVHSWNDFGVDFVGFAVYGSRTVQGPGELFRWGLGAETVTAGDPGVGYVYSSDGGQTYALLSDEASSGFTDYSLTWATVRGGLSFTVSAFDQSGAAKFDPASFFVPASSVSSIAVVATGDKRIAFDDLNVEGSPFVPVPEPGTLSLLLLGTALLSTRRRTHLPCRRFHRR